MSEVILPDIDDDINWAALIRSRLRVDPARLADPHIALPGLAPVLAPTGEL